MPNRQLRKYNNKEMQREINDRKTIQQNYRRYNNFMVFFSVFISIGVVFSIMMLFDYQVLKPQDDMTNEHFTEKTAMVSFELAGLLNCDVDTLHDLTIYDEIAMRLEENDILMFLSKKDGEVMFNSEGLDGVKLEMNTKASLESLRERYVVERHMLPNSSYTIYFLVPKSDSTLIKKTFLMFIATIFVISTIFRSGFSHTIMKRVYRNMVEPLEKLKEGTNKIRYGNFDHVLTPSLHYNREIKETFKDFEKMREQLKENKELAMQYEQNRKELISNISHDLKTPISSIIGYVEGILDGVANTPAKHDRYMQIIYKKSLDMNRLVNDLILFSKLDVNKVAFNFKSINFNRYMDVLFEEYGIELHENNVELVSRYQAKENLQLSIDQKQLRRVFNNIIGNAMKHLNKETKAIEVVVYEESEEVIIRISDNGNGIPKDKLDHIFDRFYKADASRNTEVGSSGLGLSISKQIVQAHGGKIWATSEIGEGTIIYFTLSKKEDKNG